MTVSAPIPTRHDFVGNDVATSFSYTLKIDVKTHVRLVHTDSAGVENGLADPLVVDVDYTVNGVGDAGGGTVDFPKAGSVYSTLATGEKLSIIYNLPIAQETDVPNLGRVFNEDIEKALDYITVLVNQLQEKFDRSIMLPEGSTLTDIDFPEGTSAAVRATKVAAWNSVGTALELLTPTIIDAVSVIAVKGDIAQGDAGGDAAKLAIGGTGSILSVVAGLLAYTTIGSANDTMQVVGGVPAWVTNPSINSPIIASFANAPHDHTNAAEGGLLTFRSVTLIIEPGATPGTNINVTEAAASLNYNSPTITNAANLAKSGSSGSFSLDAGGIVLTMDITENITGVISQSVLIHDINSSSTTEMYTPWCLVTGNNLAISFIKRGGQAQADMTAIFDAGDLVDIMIGYVTDS
ncbi:MAG: hypothetical protein V3U84_07785 [Thiotrichaceae bacterium]